MSNTEARKLRKILADERKAALAGQFTELNKIADEKHAIFTRLTKERLTAGELKGLSDDVARNQSIIKSAISGVKSAKAHFLAVKSASEQVSVYNSSGTLETIDNRSFRSSEKY